MIKKILYKLDIFRFRDIIYRQKLHSKFKRQFLFFSNEQNTTLNRFSLTWNNRFPCLYDNMSETKFDHHYVLHVAWAARKIAQIKPYKHIDISSSLFFCTSISAFFKTEFYDYRPADIQLDGLKMGQSDLTNLHFESNSIPSLSCMHTVEHIGLGRYGDNIDYDGDLKAINELKRVVSKDGSLLFVVPIGKAKIIFNAHRIYSYDQIITYFSDFNLMEFSLIQDDSLGGNLIVNATELQANQQSYGCGCFWFIKK